MLILMTLWTLQRQRSPVAGGLTNRTILVIPSITFTFFFPVTTFFRTPPEELFKTHTSMNNLFCEGFGGQCNVVSPHEMRISTFEHTTKMLRPLKQLRNTAIVRLVSLLEGILNEAGHGFIYSFYP